MTNPLDGFTVNRADIGYVGHELQRPECILAEPDGTLWSADARGGVMRIAQDGSQRFIGQQADARFGAAASQDAEAVEQKFTTGTLPNGLAFAANGDILISNFGTDVLEVMTRDGATRLLADTIDGQPIGKVNFVLRDAQGRIWITVSTRMNPWTQAAGTRVRDGYVAVLDGTGLYVVADGFHFTNEIRLDAAGEWLYIVETTGPHITRMRVDGTGARVRLTDREVFGPSHLGGFPDGIAFDAYGNLWCTLVMVDQLGPVSTMQGVAKVSRTCPSRRATQRVRPHAQGAQRRGAGSGELPFGLPRKGAVCGVARACKATALLRSGALHTAPLRGNAIPLHSANRPLALTPQGDKRVLLDDGNPEPSQRLLDGMANGYVSPESMLAARGSIAPWMASVTFGGPDLRTVYLGSLMGTRIPFFRAPVAGLPLAHWH